MRARARTNSKVSRLFAAAAVMWLFAILLLGYQVFTWLEYGTWPPLDGWYVWRSIGEPQPVVSWMEVQKIIDWAFRLILDAPLTLIIATVGGLLAVMGSWCKTKAES